MNIDEFTLGELKALQSMFSSTPKQSPVGSHLIGQKVIVRAYRSGVNYGTLKAIDGQNVELTNARRLWYWKAVSGISLSDVAESGIKSGSKICAIVPTQIITDACEIITTSPDAQASIEAANVYNP